MNSGFELRQHHAYSDTTGAKLCRQPGHQFMSRVATIFNTRPKFDCDWYVAQGFVHANKYFPQFCRSVEYCMALYDNIARCRRKNPQAEPLPVLNTRSMGHPQFISTKSMFGPNSLARTSAVGTRLLGLLPATCTPKICSEGNRRTNDHSSLDPARKEFANPTKCANDYRVELAFWGTYSRRK